MDVTSGIMGIIYQMKKKCAHIDQKLMDELNITQSELLFFSSIDDCNGISSNELSRTMSLSPSRVSRVVDKLVINGYLDRNIDSLDRRAITLCLTSKGKEIKKRIDSERLQCEQQVLNVLPNEEVDKFREIIDKIIKAI
jgi:MarR family transcriptional regulator, organic hydroperoxide resistance regulator